MDFTLDTQKQGTSMTGFILVIALHLALISALIFGLKVAIIPLQHIEDMTIITPPDQPPEPIAPTEPVILNNPSIPFIAPTDFTVPRDVLTPAITDAAPIGTNGGTDSGTTERAGTELKPAVLFVGAVVDAKSCDKPEYPRNALRNEYTGVVTLALLIGLDGKVSDAKIEQSSGHKELDQAALAGLSLCKFKPATLNGQAQKSWAKLQYAWNLAE
jgi:protein TonB